MGISSENYGDTELKHIKYHRLVPYGSVGINGC